VHPTVTAFGRPAARAVAAGAVAAAALVLGAGTARASVVAGTLSCTTEKQGGVSVASFDFVSGYQDVRAYFSLHLGNSHPTPIFFLGVQPPPHFEPRFCRRVTARFPLSARGLPAPASRLDAFPRCRAGARVLVRYRSVIDGQKLLAGSVAVRTAKGKPLAFAAFDRNGRGRIFLSPRCD
jgi:hypothetical protein